MLYLRHVDFVLEFNTKNLKFIHIDYIKISKKHPVGHFSERLTLTLTQENQQNKLFLAQTSQNGSS